jgi:histidyl-tRNA synthetase
MLRDFLKSNAVYQSGVDDLEAMAQIMWATGYSKDRVIIDPSVVRGLEYYTGPVFEAELTFPAEDESGQPVRFGSVGGGGRYDGLVARFRSQPVPATGFSLGVSRLYAALNHLGKLKAQAAQGPVVVTIFDKERITDYQRMVQTLRKAGIRAELYLGNPKNFGNQLKYADKRGSPCAIIQGEDERQRGEITIKDLIEGARLSGEITDNSSWREGRPAQFSIAEADLVEAVRSVLARHSGKP